uniref:Uncharacterized protein n=1 Tax=Arundo donax TaxID=35708 RepID=A0A0A8XPS5_ARUDO
MQDMLISSSSTRLIWFLKNDKFSELIKVSMGSIFFQKGPEYAPTIALRAAFTAAKSSSRSSSGSAAISIGSQFSACECQDEALRSEPFFIGGRPTLLSFFSGPGLPHFSGFLVSAESNFSFDMEEHPLT